MPVRVSVQRGADRAVPTRAQFLRWIRAAVAGRRQDAALTVRVVDAEEGAALNHQWRRKHGATNVLSFPVPDAPPAMPDLLGDIVICAPVVHAEALAQGKSPEAHWAHLVVHGTLHLLGYDHLRASEARVMESLERDILFRLGYPDPYEVINPS